MPHFATRLPLTFWLLLAIFLLLPLCAKADEPNKLTPEEIAEGWILLFDGETMYGWTPSSEANWAVKDGIVSVSEGKGGLLCTNSEFGNYELKVDFRSPEATNSGVFFAHAIEAEEHYI